MATPIEGENAMWELKIKNPNFRLKIKRERERESLDLKSQNNTKRISNLNYSIIPQTQFNFIPSTSTFRRVRVRVDLQKWRFPMAL